MTVTGKQNPKGLTKCYGKWQFYHLFNTSESKWKTKGGYMKSIGDRLWGGGRKQRGETSGVEKKVKR